MSPDDLFDEAFGQLDDVRREHLDRAAASDPVLADRRARLHRSLSRLLDDGDAIEPPEDLGRRTLAFLEKQRREEPRLLEFAPEQRRFRWSDIAAAAAVLLVGLASLLPAIRDQRRQANFLICTDNLRQVGLALNQYARVHQSYPYVDPSCPASYIGASFVQLNDAGFLNNPTVLNCPANGCRARLSALPRFDDLYGRERRQPGSCRNEVQSDYAYHLGYRDPRGRLGPIPIDLDGPVALVADQPPYRMDGSQSQSQAGRILEGNSPNHNGGGQNVLFTDGHVSYHRTRWISPADTDLYLNEDASLAPGLHSRDAVLTPAVLRFRP